MKHSINELYKIKGDEMHIYSAEAVQFVNHPKRYSKAQEGDCYRMLYKGNNRKPFRIYHSIGNKQDYTLAWQHGDKTWFDSEEELIAYREQLAAEARLRKIEKLQKTLIESAKMLEMLKGEA